MGKGSSSSEVATTTTTANYDQRVAAEASGLALGSGAAIITSNEFSENVAKAYQSLIDFAGGVGANALEAIKIAQEKSAAAGEKALETANEINANALETVNKSGEGALSAVLAVTAGAADLLKTALEAVKSSGQAALTTVAQTEKTAAAGASTIYTDLFPYVSIAAVILVIIFVFGRGK